jgi:mycothiol synthase
MSGVIKYEWRDHLDAGESAELAGMLARAAVYDAEPEYNTIDYADVAATLGSADTRHLLIWRLPRTATSGLADTHHQIAGLLRLVFTSDDVAEATVVIDPDARSIGILTMLLEQVGVSPDPIDGWAGTGAQTVTAWSRGNHPASARASDRFLIPRTRRTWKLIRAAVPDENASPAPALELLDSRTLADLGWAHGGAPTGTVVALREEGSLVGLVSLDLQPVESPEFGACATIACVAYTRPAETAAIRRMLDGVAATAHQAGLDGIAIYVDSDDATLVNACRLAGFQHDRTDVRYQLGDPC